MFQLIKFLSVFLSIAIVNSSHIVRRANDVSNEAEQAIIDIENTVKLFTKNTEIIDAKISQGIHDFKTFVKPAVKEFEQTLSSKCGIFEDKINELVHFDIFRETCKIMSICEHVTTSYNIVKHCLDKSLDDNIIVIRKTTKDAAVLADEIMNIKETIRECEGLDSNNKEKMKCLKNTRYLVYKSINKLNNFLPHVMSLLNKLKFTTHFEVCLAKNGTDLLMNNVNRLGTCLRNNVPGFDKIATEITQIGNIFQNDINDTVNKINSKVSEAIQNIRSEVENITKDFIGQFVDFQSTASNIANSTIQILQNTWSKLKTSYDKIRTMFSFFD